MYDIVVRHVYAAPNGDYGWEGLYVYDNVIEYNSYITGIVVGLPISMVLDVVVVHLVVFAPVYILHLLSAVTAT